MKRKRTAIRTISVLAAFSVCLSGFCAVLPCMTASAETAPSAPVGLNAASGSPELDYSGQKVGVLTPDDLPGYYNSVVTAIRSGVNADVEEISWENAASAVNSANYDVIVLPEAKYYPENAEHAIDTFLQNGGKLLTMGGPPLQEGKQSVGGTWMTREEAFRSAPKQTILDFSVSDNRNFYLNADNPGQLNYSSAVESGAPDGGNAVHITFGNPKNWAQAEKNVSVRMTGAHSIAFYLKGNNVFYTGLSVGINDGSGMYYATVKPSSDWKLVSLEEKDFNLWADSEIHYDRHPDLQHITKITFGISQTHVPFHMGMQHEFWISSPYLQTVGSLGAVDTVLDGIAPEYKFFPITNGETAEASRNQSFVADRDYVLPEELFSPTHRPQGTGYSRGKALRFVPLIDVSDEKQLRSGYLAWMFVHSTGSHSKPDGAYEGCIIAGFGTSDPAFYNADGRAAVVDVLRALLNDGMFVEAGAADDLYVESETSSLSVGAYLRGKHLNGMTVRFAFARNGSIFYEESFAVSDLQEVKTKSGISVRKCAFGYSVSRGKPDRIVTTLEKNGQVLDTVIHDITFWSPKPESERKYVTVKDNEFIRDGKVLRAYGVNYVPTSGIAAEDSDFWEYYLSPESFDPDVIYHDLLRLKEIGFNAISSFIYYQNATQLKSMLWLADTCDKLGIVMNIDIRPHADPFALVEDEVVTIFETQHLAELDNVICYDVAWERSFGMYEGNYGNPNGRKAYNKDWIQWVKDNYGSIEKAEMVWGEPMPCDAQGNYIGVSDAALRSGDSTKLVAAYRRFADDLIASKHAYVRELMHRLAPNHMISARAGDSGCIPSSDPAQMGYDFTATAAGLDFMSPEYYVSIDDVDQVLFTNAYARYAIPDAPVVWKEFGARSAWCGSNFDDPAYKTLRETVDRKSAENYRSFLDTIISAHTGGFYLWFSAGGYRVNEKSDCGVINPDGSDRALTEAVREYKDAFLGQQPLSGTVSEITVDRDRYDSGVRDLYEAVKVPLNAAAESGDTIVFTDGSTGKNTETVSDAAVGGGIAGAENPARWVNGVFQAVYVKNAEGEWEQIRYGDSVTVADGPLDVKTVITNLSGTEWLSESASETAYVSLVSTAQSDVNFSLPLNRNVRQLESITQEFRLAASISNGKVISFRLGIEGRFPFASPFTFTVEKKDPKSFTWDFTGNTLWKQAAHLADLPFDLPGLVSEYGSQQWVSQDNMGLMTIGGGLFIAKVPANASLNITFSGELPTVSVGATTAGTFTELDIEPVQKDGIYTLTVDGIGAENSYVLYEFPQNGGWADYMRHQLRTFTYRESDSLVWNFIDNATWKQAAVLNNLPFSLPGYVDSSTEGQWASDANAGLMVVNGGSFIIEAPGGSCLTVTFSGEGFPTISAASERDGVFTPLPAESVCNNGIYTLKVDEIGYETRYVKYTFPRNNGWTDYAYHKLRSLIFSKPKATVWDFTGNASWKQAEQLEGLPFDLPGLVTNYGSQQWVSDANMGLMTVGAGLFIVKVPTNASLEITFAGALPTVSTGATATGSFTPLDAEPMLNDGIYTLSVDGIGAENSYVMYEFPQNGGWGDYALHQLRTLTFEEPGYDIWNFLGNASWKQAEQLMDLPFFMPGLNGSYGSQQWVSDANMGLMTVGGGAFVVRVPRDASLKVTFSGALPTVSVGTLGNGPFTVVDTAPEVKNGVYTLTVDSIGAETRYVQYTFPQNGGWNDYAHHCLRTLSFRRRELIKDPDAGTLAEIRRICLGIDKADLSYDFHPDDQIDVRDLIALKKLLTGVLTGPVLRRSVLNQGDPARIARVLRKAENGEKIVIGTIGGSITQGVGASAAGNSYAEKFHSWWTAEYPDTPIEFCNAGKGATTSLMGVHRVGRELLDHDPDLVVVEFSVNDSDDPTYTEAYEGLIRQILQDDNSPAVICLFMMDKRGWNTERYHLPVAMHYDLPVISYKDALWPENGEKLYRWDEISPDDIHPNDTGHSIAAELLAHYLNTVRAELPAVSTEIPALPQPLTNNGYANARLVNSRDVTPREIVKFFPTEESYQFPGGWMTVNGGKLTVDLAGAKNVYLFYESIASGYGGTVSVSLDGGAPVSVSSDRIVAWGDCAMVAELLKGDTVGDHTVTVRVTSEAPNDKFTVLGFLVS